MLLARLIRKRSEIGNGRDDLLNDACIRIEKRQQQLQQSLAEKDEQIAKLRQMRASQEKEIGQAAIRQCAEKFLKVADALDEETRIAEPKERKALADVRNQLVEALGALGIEAFEPRPGDKYDSGLHSVWATDAPTLRIKSGCIIKTHQKGYLIKGAAPLREAAVTVAKQPEVSADSNQVTSAYEYARQAKEKLRRGDIDAALASYDRSLEMEENPCTYAGRGEARSKKGNLGGAIADFVKAARFAGLADSERRNYANRAASLRRRQERQAAPSPVKKLR